MTEGTAKRERWGTCHSCGHQNGEWENRCEKCGRRLSATRSGGRNGGTALTVPAAQNAAPSSHVASRSESFQQSRRAARRPPAFPPQLRQHLQDRVQRYRSRKENPTLELPFEPEPPSNVISFPAPPAPEPEPVREVEPPSPPAQRSPQLPLRQESRASQAATHWGRQAALDFHTGVLSEAARRHHPVAPLRLRWLAHAKDMRLIGGAWLLSLAALPLVEYFGVSIELNLLLLGGLLCGSLLMALVYGLLFVWGAGATPGMRFAGLRLVSFEGQPASRRQRFWRVLGTVVSAGSFLIGFLWAVVDEETLYWHDHISKTYLTLADS